MSQAPMAGAAKGNEAAKMLALAKKREDEKKKIEEQKVLPLQVPREAAAPDPRLLAPWRVHSAIFGVRCILAATKAVRCGFATASVRAVATLNSKPKVPSCKLLSWLGQPGQDP